MPAGRIVITKFRVFQIFTSADVTYHRYGKNVLYFFYDMVREYIITSTEERREIYRVDYSCINTALRQ